MKNNNQVLELKIKKFLDTKSREFPDILKR
jgi:hypothetical protein